MKAAGAFFFRPPGFTNGKILHYSPLVAKAVRKWGRSITFLLLHKAHSCFRALKSLGEFAIILFSRFCRQLCKQQEAASFHIGIFIVSYVTLNLVNCPHVISLPADISEGG